MLNNPPPHPRTPTTPTRIIINGIKPWNLNENYYIIVKYIFDTDKPKKDTQMLLFPNNNKLLANGEKAIAVSISSIRSTNIGQK